MSLSSDEDVNGVEWRAAERAARHFYKDSHHGSNARKQREYAYSMGFYHGLRSSVLVGVKKTTAPIFSSGLRMRASKAVSDYSHATGADPTVTQCVNIIRAMLIAEQQS